MINFDNFRIVQLDEYSMTFEVYREVENIRTHEKTFKWIREGGYYSNLEQCLKYLKDYIIKKENARNENLDIIKLLDEINNKYVNTFIKCKGENDE